MCALNVVKGMKLIMKKKQRILIVVLVLILIISILLVILWPKESEKNYTKKEIIELVSNGYANGISKEELSKLLDQEIVDETMMTGEDAYLLQTPSEKQINKYNLDDYVKANKTYFNNLEKKIKENYFWEFDGDVQGNSTTFPINVKTYSYGIYISDLKELQSKLLENYNFGNKEANQYKAKVVGMKILNSHLNDYINDTQKTIVVSFNNLNDDETINSLNQYLADLGGYNNMYNEKFLNMEINRTGRMQSYLNEAISNGTLDQNDILKI